MRQGVLSPFPRQRRTIVFGFPEIAGSQPLAGRLDWLAQISAQMKGQGAKKPRWPRHATGITAVCRECGVLHRSVPAVARCRPEDIC